MTLRPPERVAAHHHLHEFDCGVASLNEWLRRRALANEVSGASRTFVVCDGDRIAGYYALASGSVSSNEAPGRFRRNMPDPLPVAILARLAIARSHQRCGLGRALLCDAVKRVLIAADQIGIRGLLVHAISDDAKAFYIAEGFAPCPLNEMTLAALLDDLQTAL